MSNYTITTDFGAKDSLPSSNSAKVVRGSEFTTEFTNIQTAIATKADTAGDTFTGVVNFSADVAVNTNTLFVDVSEAKVGIGTSSPARALHVSSGTTNEVARFESTDTACLVEFKDTTGTASIETRNDFRFTAGGSERMRIDSSGNVLVGTTTTEIANATTATGIVLNNGGWYEGSRDGGTVGYFNRLSSDGNITEFRKDGTTVGSIGTNSGNIYLTDGARSLIVDGSVIKAGYSTGGDADNVQDLGSSTVRFKDLHLSGAGYIPDVRSTSNQYITHNDGNFLAIRNSSGAERMRIDSSGNLLVGRTSDAFDVEGLALRNSPITNASIATFTRDSSNVAAFNRLTNDGSLVTFYKDSTTLVGSIGTVSGDIRIGGSDDNHAGVRFAASTKSVIPVKNTDGDLSDNTTDLGASNSRFKDLHLSGTGYSDSLLVGTTGATANAKLKVNGAVILNANTIYSKSYATLDTTGDVVAKATGGANGSSITFIFTGQGGGGAPFHVVFSCINAGGQWSATRSEIAASASVDVVASTSGNDVLFTFKSKSGSQGYSPRVRIETIGNTYDATYLAA